MEENNSLIVRKELQKYTGILILDPLSKFSFNSFDKFLSICYEEALNKNKIKPADSSFEAKDQQVLVVRGDDRL